MGRVLEFIPLAAFLLAMRNITPSNDNYWLITYGTSAVAAIGCISFKVFTHEFQHKILLGINCYIISGAVGIVAKQTWVLQIYSSLQSAAMLLWIMGIGILSLLFSNWFPVTVRRNTHARLYESMMTLLTIGAFGLAYSSPENKLLAETIPFFTLFITYYLLTSKLQSKQVT
ncbi:hypothetical protein [Halodesulfovibrio aestuarii]|uniref:Uncharacterized protein n=1 Tax=Halodesulfovibrio aestuarii TaxID=126333 RepID=A0ABV4JNN2_9BACT